MNEFKSILIHCSTSSIGGAEKSVLNEIMLLRNYTSRIIYVLPESGDLAIKLDALKIPYVIIKWPGLVSYFNQRNLLSKIWAFPLLIFHSYSFIRYWIDFLKIQKNYMGIWSSGIKSHCLLLPLSPWLNKKIVLNIRDFIYPLIFRKFISLFSKVFRIKVVANSNAVGRNFPGCLVQYPRVNVSSKISLKKNKAPIVITHVSFFAPYKGQDLFLDYAEKIIQMGLDVNFNIIGDVIYPGEIYQNFKKEITNRVSEKKFLKKVSLLGKSQEVQKILGQSHYLFHCTREPEPFGRVIMEALLCGCKVLCHEGSGACEVLIEDSETTLEKEFGITSINKHHKFFRLPKKESA